MMLCETIFCIAKVKVFIPMYQPLQVSKCEKCGKAIARPRELIKIGKAQIVFFSQH